MILKNAMEITFARVELTSSELEISFPIHQMNSDLIMNKVTWPCFFVKNKSFLQNIKNIFDYK